MRNLNYPYWLGLLASIIGISTPFIPIVRESKYEILFALAIALIPILFVLKENLYLKKHWRRKKKYPEIFCLLNEAADSLNQLQQLKNPDTAAIKSCFAQSCTKIAELFSKVTNSKCAVSIKVLKGDFNVQGFDTGIDTFVRDNISYSNRSNPGYQSAMIIEENTDFKEICQNLKNGRNPIGHFFSNDLLKNALKGYKNSRFGHEFYEVIRKYNNADGYRLLKKIWSLEYRSAIVVPIYSLNSDKNQELTGFLCVDSPNLNAFLEYDIDILHGLATTLFNHRNYIKTCYANSFNNIILNNN